MPMTRTQNCSHNAHKPTSSSKTTLKLLRMLARPSSWIQRPGDTTIVKGMLQYCKLLHRSALGRARHYNQGNLFVLQDCVECTTFCRVALFHLEEYETAKAAFETGQALDPNNSSFKTWIRKCAAEIDGMHWHYATNLVGTIFTALSSNSIPTCCISYAVKSSNITHGT